LNDVNIAPLQSKGEFTDFLGRLKSNKTGWNDLTSSTHDPVERGAMIIRMTNGEIKVLEGADLKAYIQEPLKTDGVAICYIDKELGKIKPLAATSLSEINNAIKLIQEFKDTELSIVVATCNSRSDANNIKTRVINTEVLSDIDIPQANSHLIERVKKDLSNYSGRINYMKDMIYNKAPKNIKEKTYVEVLRTCRDMIDNAKLLSEDLNKKSKFVTNDTKKTEMQKQNEKAERRIASLQNLYVKTALKKQDKLANYKEVQNGIMDARQGNSTNDLVEALKANAKLLVQYNALLLNLKNLNLPTQKIESRINILNENERKLLAKIATKNLGQDDDFFKDAKQLLIDANYKLQKVKEGNRYKTDPKFRVKIDRMQGSIVSDLLNAWNEESKPTIDLVADTLRSVYDVDRLTRDTRADKIENEIKDYRGKIDEIKNTVSGKSQKRFEELALTALKNIEKMLNNARLYNQYGSDPKLRGVAAKRITSLEKLYAKIMLKRLERIYPFDKSYRSIQDAISGSSDSKSTDKTIQAMKDTSIILAEYTGVRFELVRNGAPTEKIDERITMLEKASAALADKLIKMNPDKKSVLVDDIIKRIKNAKNNLRLIENSSARHNVNSMRIVKSNAEKLSTTNLSDEGLFRMMADLNSVESFVTANYKLVEDGKSRLIRIAKAREVVSRLDPILGKLIDTHVVSLNYHPSSSTFIIKFKNPAICSAFMSAFEIERKVNRNRGEINIVIGSSTVDTIYQQLMDKLPADIAKKIEEDYAKKSAPKHLDDDATPKPAANNEQEPAPAMPEDLVVAAKELVANGETPDQIIDSTVEAYIPALIEQLEDLGKELQNSSEHGADNRNEETPNSKASAQPVVREDSFQLHRNPTKSSPPATQEDLEDAKRAVSNATTNDPNVPPTSCNKK